NVGSGTPNATSYVDTISFNGTTYNFELDPYTPTAPVAKPTLSGEVIFDSIPSAIPGNSVSQAFQATKTKAFGDKITFAGTSRDLSEAAFTLSSWACETGSGTTCVTTPGAKFNHPITLNLY